VSNVIFPKFPGQAFSVIKTPQMRTLISEATSGVESRLSLWTNPIWNIELTFNYLQSRQPYAYVGQIPNSGTLISPATMQANDFDALSGFFLARGGAFDDFLFDDPTDNAIAQAVLGIGDTTGNVNFQAIRQRGEFSEVVQNLNGTPLGCGTWSAGLPVTAGVGSLVPTAVGMLLGTQRLYGHWQTAGWPCYYTPGTTGTTGTTEPDWRKASNFNDVVQDGTTSWVNQGPVSQLWLDAPSGLSGWASTHTYGANACVVPGSGNAGGYCFVTPGGGVSGGVTPTWPQTFGATVSDGSGSTAITWYNFGIAPIGPTGFSMVPQFTEANGSAAWSVNSTGLVTLAQTVSVGVSVILSSGFYYRVRFKQDNLEFEEFMNRFFKLKQVQLRGIKL